MQPPTTGCKRLAVLQPPQAEGRGRHKLSNDSAPTTSFIIHASPTPPHHYHDETRYQYHVSIFIYSFPSPLIALLTAHHTTLFYRFAVRLPSNKTGFLRSYITSIGWVGDPSIRIRPSPSRAFSKRVRARRAAACYRKNHRGRRAAAPGLLLLPPSRPKPRRRLRSQERPVERYAH